MSGRLESCSGGASSTFRIGAEVPAEFRRAVKLALRSLHEARRLARSPLLSLRAVGGVVAGDVTAVAALQRVLRLAIAELSKSVRTEGMHRALHFAFVEPAGTQMLAADQAKMSFGSFRRYLAAGVEEVALRLWINEGSTATRLPSGGRGTMTGS